MLFRNHYTSSRAAVNLHKESASPLAFDRLSGPKAARVFHVGNDNGRSLASKAVTGGLPDSLAASGNNGDFVFEFYGSSVLCEV